jgi:PiT family inorganic phosphate transporter
VVGAGAAKHVSAVRWGVAGNIVLAWVLTLPAAGLIGAVVYAVAGLFGNGATGPVLIAMLLLASLAAVVVRRVQQTTPSPVTT